MRTNAAPRGEPEGMTASRTADASLTRAIDAVCDRFAERGVAIEAEVDGDAVLVMRIDRARRASKGLGATALQELFEVADAAGKVVRLHVWSGNEDLQNYYERQGFSVIAPAADPEGADDHDLMERAGLRPPGSTSTAPRSTLWIAQSRQSSQPISVQPATTLTTRSRSTPGTRLARPTR